jgi:hypothetical protein
MFAPAANVQEAVAVELAEVARGEALRCRLAADVAANGGPADLNLAARVDRELDVRQGPTDAANTPRGRRVQSHDRGALGETVAFIDGQREAIRALEQRG